MAFVPRLDDYGIRGSKWWYSNSNIFYASGYELPNCTCYAYGRVAEANNRWLRDIGVHGNGGTWWDEFNREKFSYGSTPQLGAILCLGTTPQSGSHVGHVAVVEEIGSGYITTSNSYYGGSLFATETVYERDGYIPSWAKQGGGYNYRLQGFIYCCGETPPTPPTPIENGKLKLWQMAFPWNIYKGVR